jgi:hypothetical protein
MRSFALFVVEAISCQGSHERRLPSSTLMRQGANYFTTCDTCGALGHSADTCPLKNHYHTEAIHQIAKGSRDPEILREVYGNAPAHRC